MSKKSKGGSKLRQQGMPPSHHLKKAHKRAEKAPWGDPVPSTLRGGNRH